MGNTCNAETVQKQIKHESKTELYKADTTEQSNFVDRMNEILDDESTLEKGKSIHSSNLKYLQPKRLEDEGLNTTIENKEIFLNLLRFQLRGKLFLYTDSASNDVSMKQENEQEVNSELSQSNIREISKVLESHCVFMQLSQEQRHETAKKMKICKVQAGQFVFSQGDNADKFFIIAEGQCQVIIEGEIRKVLEKGQSFGEYALLFATKRSASVKTRSKCQFWSTDRVTFKKVVEDISIKVETENRQFLQKTDFFKYLSPLEQQSVLNVLVTLQFQPSDIIVNSGQAANQFYIIKTGQVKIIKQNAEAVILNAGSQFGQKSLEVQNFKRTETVTAETNCTLLCIGKDNITEALGLSLQEVINKNIAKTALEKSKTFRQIAHDDQHQIFQEITLKRLNKGEKLMKKGHVMKCIYIPMNIELSSADKKYQTGQIIEQNLLTCGKSLPHGVKAESEGNVLVIKYSAEYILNVKNQHPTIDPDSIKLDNILVIRKIGNGQFGQVYAGLHTATNTLVAIKCISKKTVQKFSIQKQIVSQQAVMKRLNHPFIQNYYHTFNTKRDVCFIIQYIAGREFFDVIRDIGLLRLNQAQFYTAQILLALEYMHSMEIVYRDLKPQNIMIDNTGYVKLIDMGTAKSLKKENFYKTRTIIGTPHYMAPQAISGKGYNFLVDIWSLGVVLYELVCGYLPNEEKLQDPFQIYNSIMSKNITFPDYVKDQNVKQIITKMLSRSPEARMKKGHNELKKMAFFSDLNWSVLQRKQMTPPYKISSNMGISIDRVQAKGLDTLHQFIQKRTLKDGHMTRSSKKQISWQANLQ